jgi:hypothetical protein
MCIGRVSLSVSHGGLSAVLKLVKLFAESVNSLFKMIIAAELIMSNRVPREFISKTNFTAAKRLVSYIAENLN